MRTTTKGSASRAAPPRGLRLLGVVFTTFLLMLGLISPAAADNHGSDDPTPGECEELSYEFKKVTTTDWLRDAPDDRDWVVRDRPDRWLRSRWRDGLL